MNYGVTPAGFVRMRLPEIRQGIIDDWQARLRQLGYADTIETRPDSLAGILIDTIAERFAASWEIEEGGYLAMYPASANGTSLDNAVSFTGVTRLGAEKSRCYVVCYGVPGTRIAAGSQIKSALTQTLWEVTSDLTISSGQTADVTLVPSVASSQTYTVTIDGTTYSYTSDATATLSEVLAGITAALSPTPWNVSSDGAAIRVVADGRASFAISVSGPLMLSNIGTPVLAETITPSTDSVGVGALNVIVTTVTGWQSVTNLQPASPGRHTETDAELRARYPTGVYRLGAATLPSMAPNVRDKQEGIRAIRVFENDSDVPDMAGRPPHSIHVVVDGGLEDEIASAIHRTKAAGIDTFGQVLVDVVGPDGTKHPVRFDRPTPVFVWIRAVLTFLPFAEELFPPDGFQSIAADLSAAGQELNIGDDVIAQRFYCAIYKTRGIAHADLSFAHSSDPAFVPGDGHFSDGNIAIADYAFAKFDLSRVQVT